MSSGSLPLATYHRAQSLGAGAYGSVVTVYDDDGNEFALKLFDDVDEEEEAGEYEEEDDEYEQDEDEDDDEEEDDNSGYEDDDEEEYEENATAVPMDLGALREISILRLLRHENSHPNVIAISDVKQANDITEEEQEDVTMRFPGIAMPLFPHGTLTDAISYSHEHLDKKNKVRLAHGILSAIAFLHANGIIHRDIKSDNIMVQIDEDGRYHPILIDFSLAKVVEPTRLYSKTSSAEVLNDLFTVPTSGIEGEDTHTSSIGTPTYRAPECVREEPYGLPSDLYSVGVVLLELLRGGCIESFKDKGAFKIVAEVLDQLPNQPFANMVRGLLENDPKKRLTAKEALDHPLFQKFGFEGLNYDKTFRVLNLKEALPLEEEGEQSSDPKTVKKRMDLVQKICNDLDCENPLTFHAAWAYATQLLQLDDCIYNLEESQGLIDCVVLASRFFEKELWGLDGIEELDRGVFKKCTWSAHDYIDNEGTIWMLMDFCLLPRELIQVLT